MKKISLALLLTAFLILTVGCSGTTDVEVDVEVDQGADQGSSNLVIEDNGDGQDSTEAEGDVEGEKFPTFTTEDLYGNEVTEEIFSGYDLTMVNIWGTFCSPCIREMPELEELYQELKEENINLIGIVADNKPADAVALVEDLGVTYTNLLPDSQLDSYLRQYPFIPTTVFVDGEGNLVGDPKVGAASKEEYRKTIDKVIEEME